MKNTFTGWAVIIGVCGFVPAVQAAEKCDHVVLLSLSNIMEPTRDNWTHTWKARFLRLADNVEMSPMIERNQLSESIIRGALYDFGHHFWLCSDNGKVRLMPVLK